MTFRRAKLLCGLPDDFFLRNELDYTQAINFWRAKTVEARKNGNDNHAAVLSQCKQIFKERHAARQSKICPDCGGAKSANGVRCQSCSFRWRFYKNQLNENNSMKEYEVVLGTTLIPPRTTYTGILTCTLRKLTEGQVGDSFVTKKHSCVVKAAARNLGLEVICRCINPEERDKAKRMYGVWRSDGMTMEQVNEIIQKRLKGEAVPPPKPCVPDPKLLAKKHPKKGTPPGRPKIEVPRTL